ncbi:hypothetical protein [Streptomyces odontomachi]|uniref:hypothetical protein n=1 Tax=Streptomyces odontomachi TaxID=2944940 RepID=UPI0021088F63|nr:hypothetical protein [Streptomyces sp. ODS25]
MSPAPFTGDQGLAGELPYGHARGLARDLVRKLGRTDARARRLAHGLAFQRHGATSSDVDLALDVADILANLHIRAARLPAALGTPRSVEARTTYLSQGLEWSSGSSHELARQLDRTDPRGSAHARRVAQGCDEATALLGRFTTALHRPDEAAAALSGRRRVSLPAQWLIDSAARVLPAPDRPRYAEEWRSELWDLAAEPRRRHLAHALRVTIRAWPTRRAILHDQRDHGGWEW